MNVLHPDVCLYCGRDFELVYGHWRLCGHCSADYIASLKPRPPKDKILEIHREREAFRRRQAQGVE